jgi:spore coat polysaccharide biosynthesis protein SpsF
MCKKKNIVAIIQARLTSTRLPKKIFLKIDDRPMLWHVVERVKQAQKIDKIVLAIPDSSNNDELEIFIKKYNWNIFRGSENDVLSRYFHAAKQFDADIIIRITSDCPLVDPGIIDEAIKKHVLEENNYTAIGVEGGYPRGLDVEVFDFKSLEAAYINAVSKSQREHVTLFIYENPKLFRIRFIEANGALRRPEIRLTVDTEEDLLLVKEIYLLLKKCGDNFSTKDVLAIIDNNPHMQIINKHITQKDIHSL